MGREYNTHMNEEKFIQSVGKKKTEGKRLFSKSKRTWEDIKWILKKG
jgi:hypothetical protein